MPQTSLHTPDDEITILTRVAQSAADAFGLDGASPITLLNHRENAVFRIDDRKTGKPYALRVHRADYQTRASIESELYMGRILKEAGISTPLGIAAPDGSLVVQAGDDALDGPRLCSLLGWLNGEPMEEGEGVGLADTWEKLGELNARVHKVFDATALPPEFTRQVWGENGLIGKNCLWGYYRDVKELTPDQVDLLDRAAAKAREKLLAFGKEGAKYGLIHADLMPSNILVEGDTMHIIDFDDSGFGWRLYELATSLFIQELEDHRDDLIQAWVRGYRSVTDLPEADLTILPALIMARRLKILGWMSTRPDAPIVQEMGEMMIESSAEIARRFLEDSL